MYANVRPLEPFEMNKKRKKGTKKALEIDFEFTNWISVKEKQKDFDMRNMAFSLLRLNLMWKRI